MKKLKIAFVIGLILTLVGYLLYREGTLPVNSKDTSSTIFVIKHGESIPSIANKLENAHLIRNKLVFFFIVKMNGLDQKIQAGDFRLSPSMPTEKIAKSLTKGTVDVWVTIIEGLRKEEIAQIVANALSLPENELATRATEGYLFPDTYLMPRNSTVDRVLNIFANNYNRKFDEALHQQMTDKGLTENETLTLASLVEKEARSDKNKQIVASIILKRYKQGWPLQIDATVQYAIGYQVAEKTWWKRHLSVDDLKINSPYNTYKNPGLPPGPICNPGLSSIKAVLNANVNTPYWYYISSSDGTTMHYARTNEEHAENIRKYLR